MRILSTILFTFSLLFSAHARDEEPKNAEAVKAVKRNLFGVNPLARGGSGGGLYVSVDFGSRQMGEDPVNNFSAVGDDGTREGTVPIHNRSAFADLVGGDMAASMGYQAAISGGASFRVEGGYRYMRFDLDNPSYTRFDFAPISLDQLNQLVEFSGTAEASGFRGGAFLDLHLGDSGSFIYVGSTYGLLNVAAQYDLAIGSQGASLDDNNNASVMTGEVGTVIRFGGRTGLRIGYELTRFGQVDLTTTDGSALAVTPGNRHMVKIGLFHFFRRR